MIFMTSTPRLESVQVQLMVPKSQEELLKFVIELQTAQEEANALVLASLLAFLRDKGALTPLECDEVLQAPRAILDRVHAARRQASGVDQGPDQQSEAVLRTLDSSTHMIRGFLELFEQRRG